MKKIHSPYLGNTTKLSHLTTYSDSYNKTSDNFDARPTKTPTNVNPITSSKILLSETTTKRDFKAAKPHHYTPLVRAYSQASISTVSNSGLYKTNYQTDYVPKETTKVLVMKKNARKSINHLNLKL